MKNINYAKQKNKKKKHQITNQSKMLILKIKKQDAYPQIYWIQYVERENSRPITSWHVILPSPQNTANYKAPHITARFCYHYSETNKNLPSVMQKPNHTSANVSNDTSNLVRISNDICNPAHVSDDISKPIRLWHVSPIRLCHVSLTHPQTPINRNLPKTFQRG